ncbi:MAG TPA: AAA family ATPase [Gammaproteobacteria bacterium]|nr:AAA family ATPase [Gammaproteobacteria bacterium]
MYHAHFGLEHGLFGEGIAEDSAVFRAAKHDRLVAHFKLALASPSSIIVLHGPAGVGKTTLTSTALRAISTRLALAWVGGMATNATELLELILVELGISTLRTTRMERLQLWRQFQGEMRATDSRLFIVVERTEDLSTEVLHALDQLTAPDAVGNPGANVVLLGHAGIHDHLAAPLLDSLRQRIRLRTELEPFTEAELQDYLRYQVTAAGGQYDRIFAPGAVASLHRYSQGVARLANTLCESALDIAAVQQQKQLTPDLVAKTAVTLLGLAGGAPAGQLAPAVQPAPAAQAAASARTPTPPVEVRPAATAPIFERRAEPRVPPASASPSSPTAARAGAPATQAAAAGVPPALAHLEIEFDGGATDVADVAVADFPVLTDAIEAPATKPAEPPSVKPPAPPAAKPAAAAPAAKAASAAQASAPAAKAAPAAAATVAAKPAPKPAGRVEPTHAAPAKPTPPKPAPAQPTTTPLPHHAAAKAAATGASAPRQPAADDEARQTQTVRAIAEAKSLDDLSDIDAETLFGDAELDLVSAALASAAEWPDDQEPTAAPTPSLGDTTAKKAAVPSDEALDLFGLDDNAPLELIDDATLPPMSPGRKTASR